MSFVSLVGKKNPTSPNEKWGRAIHSMSLPVLGLGEKTILRTNYHKLSKCQDVKGDGDLGAEIIE